MDQPALEPRGLAAGGTLGPAPETPARWRWLTAELLLLYVGLPVAITYLVRVHHISVIVLLQPILIGVVVALLIDRRFSLARELGRLPPARLILSILALFVAAAGALTLFVAMTEPDALFSFPRRAPQFWLLVMLLYPLLSAFPQEILFRTLFFHRYGALFGERRALIALVNGALFGLAHVMFGSWLSVALSAAFGALLSWRYTRARSFWAAWLEHALYGNFIFTVGLGRHFFTGNSLWTN